MVSVEQLSVGILNFVDVEMLPSLPVNMRWIAGALLIVAQGKVPKIINNYASQPLISALELINEEGVVDLAAIKTAIKTTCQKNGAAKIEIPMIGQFEITEKNFDKLFKLIGDEPPKKVDADETE